MFSDLAKSHADACRFCWMCRHICPVALATGKEGSTPRGKAFVVSMDSRNIPLGKDAAGVVYECCLCGACSNDCATGYQPPLFVREARTKLVAEELICPEITKLVDAALEGRQFETKPDKTLLNSIKNLPKSADVLLYLGSAARHHSAQSAIDLMTILKSCSVEFTAFEQEPPTGSYLGDLIGYTEEVREMAGICAKQITKTGAKKLIVFDPSDAQFIKQQWVEWGIKPDLEVVTATMFLAELLDKGTLKLKNVKLENATFHDPCRLSRGLDEAETPRKLLKAMGIEINEMLLNRKLTRCCSGAVFSATNQKMSTELVSERWKDAALCGTNTIITACPECQYILGKGIAEGNTICDIYSLVVKASV